ncbi:predicted protein [Coccidioides posadasii str. Silveira]|uniref:Predicted protein n=1 Tax=Coccidioides posadasii (strain RMSCC 757 / Silveira) TaxID=443226 RepID=E9D262_COCPS|nr:predicted protein [Coccidioides posadasii str. Silveira]
MGRIRFEELGLSTTCKNDTLLDDLDFLPMSLFLVMPDRPARNFCLFNEDEAPRGEQSV